MVCLRSTSISTGFFFFGFFFSGSPFAERVKRFDERRIQNLEMLQYEVINFWQAKETLPTSLDNLRDDIRGFVPPVDPETKTPYGYRAIGTQEFELCAVFKTDTVEDAVTTLPLKPIPVKESYGDLEQNWQHQAGEFCFRRVIDPDLY